MDRIIRHENVKIRVKIRKFRLLLALLFAALAAAFLPNTAQAQTRVPPTPEPGGAPAGFVEIDAAPGIRLYRKDYANGNPDFVQVIDLSQGAEVQLLHGQITETRPTHGSYGGPDPRFTSPPIQNYWRDVALAEENLFCIINGSFFYMPEYPTRLAFPLKVDGVLLTEGWGIKTYVDQKLILELWPGRAEVRSLTKESLYDSTAPNILGGLTEEANKRAKYAVGRTFAGLDDRDGDGAFETVLFLSTRTARQVGAAAVLREFDADRVMMLDGGGSTQLMCKSGHYIRSDRPIPQALAIIAADPPALEAELARPPEWLVLEQGRRIPIELEIRNTGVISWTALDARFLIDPSPSSSPEWLPVHQTIEPGETAMLTDTLPPAQPGAYLLDIGWGIRLADKSFIGEPVQLTAIILPHHLAERETELQKNLAQWKTRPPDEVQSLVRDWIEANAAPTEQPTVTAAAMVATPAPAIPAGRIRPADVVWIPLIMLPIMLIIGIWIGKRNISTQA